MGEGLSHFALLSSPCQLFYCLQIPFSLSLEVYAEGKRERETKEREREGGWAHGEKIPNLMTNMKTSVFFPDWLLCTDVPMVV